MQAQKEIQSRVNQYWNAESCGTHVTKQEKFSAAYYQEIEEYRYRIEPEIFSFAQFTRFYKKKVLEVGMGAGTDFEQFIKAGAYAYGIDATVESINHVKARLKINNLSAADLQVADAHELPYDKNIFDCVYSWGVIHHAQDMRSCFEEIVRVTKPGGVIKIMVYHRYSLFAFYRWLIEGLFKGKPFRSLNNILYDHQESMGTRAYTKKEILNFLSWYPVKIIRLDTPVTQHDLLFYKSRFFRFLAYIVASILGFRKVGWFMMIELKKMI